MIHNAYYWSQYFRAEFVPQLSALVDVLENRILPGFEDIEDEAKRVTDDAWKRFMSMPSTGEEDPSEFAEKAEQVGVSHYFLLVGVRQGMLNLFAAALYHTLEQQIMLLHRKEVLRPSEEDNLSLLKLSEFQIRLSKIGIDITKFTSWPMIDELRLAANVVKHGDGGAAKKLHERRPDLFENPHTASIGSLKARGPRVFQPLVGDDLYVSLKDLKRYGESCVGFWHELSDALKNTEHTT